MGQGKVIAPSGGVQVPWAPVQERGKCEQDIDRWIEAASEVMWMLYLSVGVKADFSWELKLSIYLLVCGPTLTYGHELQIVTKKMRLQRKAAEMNFLGKVVWESGQDSAWTSPSEGVSGMPIWGETLGQTQDMLKRLYLLACL